MTHIVCHIIDKLIWKGKFLSFQLQNVRNHKTPQGGILNIFLTTASKNSMTRRQESEKEKWNSRWKGRPTLSVATSYQITSDKWSYCSTKSFWNCLFLCRKMRNKFFAASVFLCILIILTVWLNVKLGVHACVVYFQVGSQFNRSKKLSSETLSAMDGQWELFWSSFGQSTKAPQWFSNTSPKWNRREVKTH